MRENLAKFEKTVRQLIEFYQDKVEAADMCEVFERLAGAVATSYKSELVGKDLGQRLAVLTSYLEKNDFSPQTEVSGGNLQIRLLNCPFRAVALRHEDVCGFDRNVISSLLHRQITQQSCINPGDGGCSYATKLAANEPEQLMSVLSA